MSPEETHGSRMVSRWVPAQDLCDLKRGAIGKDQGQVVSGVMENESLK